MTAVLGLILLLKLSMPEPSPITKKIVKLEDKEKLFAKRFNTVLTPPKYKDTRGIGRTSGKSFVNIFTFSVLWVIW